MRRQHVQLEAPSTRGSGDVLAFGHYGRPILAFPPLAGRAWDFDDNGVIDALAELLEGGRVKLYCVDGREADGQDSRAAYEAWVVDRVLPFVYSDCAGPLEVLTFGCDDGASVAADLTLTRADLFPVSICLSGRYEAEVVETVARLGPDHVDWMSGRVTVVLGAADEADREAAAAFSGRLGELGIRNEVHSAPASACGWPAWRDLAAAHIPRFC